MKVLDEVMSLSTASLQRLASRRNEAVLQGITSFNIFASMRSVQRFQLATQGLFEGLALGLGRLEIRVRPLYLVLVLVHEGVACIFPPPRARLVQPWFPAHFSSEAHSRRHRRHISENPALVLCWPWLRFSRRRPLPSEG